MPQDSSALPSPPPAPGRPAHPRLAERGAWVLGGGLAGLYLAEACLARHSPFWALVAAVPHLSLLALCGAVAWFGWRRGESRAAWICGLLVPPVLLWSGLSLPLERLLPQAAATPGQRPLRLVTFNLHDLDQGVGAVRQALQEADAEIVCLQEVPAGQPVQDLCPSGEGPWTATASGYLAVLSRYPIRERREVELSDPGAMPRPALVVRVEAPAGPVTVVDVHLSVPFHPAWLARGLAPIPSRLRRAHALRQVQAENLVRLVRTLDPPVVLAGDFNGSLSDPAVQDLRSLGRDAFQEAGWGFGYTFPTAWPMLRLDHVLVPRGWSVDFVRVPSVGASDHRPLVVQVKAEGRGARP